MISVLYVDDEETLLEICRIFLEQTGELKIHTEISARKALERISEESFDAIISDYQMPDMDGIDLLKNIRASGNTIPFIIFTGRGREEVAVEALKEGADFYLQKGGDPGVQFAELFNQIRQIVRQRKAESAVRENEQKYRALYEYAYDAILLMAEDRITDCNPQAERLLGRNREEILGHSLESFSPQYQQDGSSSQELVQQKIAVALNGTFQSFEWRCIRGDGRLLDSEISLNRIVISSGYMLIFVIRDISARKRNEAEIARKSEELASSNEELMSVEAELREQYRLLISSEQALRESESKLNAIIQGSPIPQFVINNEHRVLYWNTALAEYSRIPAGEVLGTDSHWMAFYPAKRPCLADLLIDGALESLAVWYKGKDIRPALIPDAYTAEDFFPHMGTEGTWLSFTAAVIRDEYDSVIGAVETLEDITARKNYSLALAESESLYRGMIENLQDVFYRSDNEGRFIMASPSLERVLGYLPDECVGKKIAESVYFHPSDRERFIAAIQKTGSVSNFEVLLKHRDGRPVFVSTSSHIFPGPDGTPAGIEGIFRDVTSIKEAEMALMDSEERFRTLFSHANDAIFLHGLSADGLPEQFIEVNETACNRLGYLRDELLRMSPRDIDISGTDQKERERTEIIQKNGHATFEAVHLTKNGMSIPVEISAHIHEFRGEKVVLSIARDISERKRYETAIQNANEKLNLLSRITRHDILNQLTTLSGYLDLSEEIVDNPQGIEFIHKEKKAAEAILRQILFTRDYQTIGIQSPIWQNVHETIKRAAALLDVGSLRLEIYIGDIEIFADPLLEKVFFNLIDNSLRYGIRLSGITFSFERSGDDLILVCSDDGGGIPPAEKENIFIRKFYSNTGFGLFLSREILSITGLTIRESGRYGEGVRFEIHVPPGNYRISGG